MDSLNIGNLEFIEALYRSYERDPSSVDPSWHPWFERMGGLAQPRPSWAPTAGQPVHQALRRAPLFAGLADEDLEALAAATRWVSLAPDEVLFEQGDPGEDVYVIASGRVRVEQEGRVLTELGSGQVFGEVALMDRQPRSASAVAGSEVALLRIDGAHFLRLLERRAGFALALLGVLSERLRRASATQERVDQLVRAYRERGHVRADLDPLGMPTGQHPELTMEHYGLHESDLDTHFSSRNLGGRGILTLREILALLERTYCGAIGVQYMHIDDLEVQRWIQRRMETESGHSPQLSRDEQLAILRRLTDAEVFEQFLHRKFLGAKRFSLEGGESLIPLMALAIEAAGSHGAEEIVIGMAHRGRLNVMANILGKSPAQIFREFADQDPDVYMGRGDVKYHLGHSSDWTLASGGRIHLTLCFNPSHLEFVGPVAIGRARAKQHRRGDTEGRTAIPLVIHGDSAIAGEGVVQELFNMSELEGYRVGGTVHVVLNNQIGFTTTADRARSTRYCTDLARMLQVPIWHVNGENPEAVANVIRLAMQFRSEFERDVIIDMYCYRRHGHNEGDEPAFTQPLVYKAIRQRKSVRDAYVENLLELGGITADEADVIAAESADRLERHLEHARQESYRFQPASTGAGLWTGYAGGADSQVPEAHTALPLDVLGDLLISQSRVPDGFTAHPKIQRLLDQRREMAEGARPLDWGAGELLAFASLLREGHHVRLSGQDSGRGTFSHRHAVLRDIQSGELYLPLHAASGDKRRFEVWDSPLTETAVLGFDYGYSLDYPDGLIIWEAQFGDFANVAQVIIDQFICSAEDKWRRLSALVLLLPHGFEGQGPEHSSARIERWLTLAAEDNMQVVNLTTPAQLFHCLRRQVVRPYRKPLIVMSPKSLLRHPEAVSSLDDLATGGFQRVIPDHEVLGGDHCRKIVLVSGKLFYELSAWRREQSIDDVALIRVEQYYPLQPEPLASALSSFPAGVPVVWAQEEPANMGAWPFMERKLPPLLGGRTLTGISRRESASPATGSAAAHKVEQQRLIERIFA